jgi:hypothetical protein
LIRENDKLWGDFCKRRVDREGNFLDEPELKQHGYDMAIPGIRISKNQKNTSHFPQN